MCVLGKDVTPRQRAAIIVYRSLPQPMSYRAIAKLLGVPASTANNIFHHAVSNATAKREREEAAQPARDEEEEAVQPAREEDEEAAQPARDEDKEATQPARDEEDQ